MQNQAAIMSPLSMLEMAIDHQTPEVAGSKIPAR
jgi:hypothetical protein